jgi:hypothetical protein
VVRDNNGEVLSVRYEQVNAMLLNEFLKEHKKIDKLQATVANLLATVKEQAPQIQKVSAQLEVSKRTAKVVANNQKSCETDRPFTLSTKARFKGVRPDASAFTFPFFLDKTPLLLAKSFATGTGNRLDLNFMVTSSSDSWLG